MAFLPHFGEFRLEFIVTIPKANSPRGRKGHVFQAIHSVPVLDEASGVGYNFALSVLNHVPDGLLDREYCGDKTHRDLEAFALYTFERLRSFGGQDSDACAADILELTSANG